MYLQQRIEKHVILSLVHPDINVFYMAWAIYTGSDIDFVSLQKDYSLIHIPAISGLEFLIANYKSH